MRTINLFRNFCTMGLKKLMEYRLDFLIGIFPMLLTQLAGILFLKIVFLNISDLSGWGYYECMMIYGFYITASSVEEMLFGNFRSLKGYVFTGEFDLILLKPIHPVVHLILLDFDGNCLFQFILGIIILGYSMGKMHLAFTFGTVFFIIAALVVGVLFLSALTILIACIYFYTEGTFSLFNVIWTFKSFAKYPVTIFGGILGFFMKWILPVSVVSYFPVMLILKGNSMDRLLYTAAGLGVMSAAFIIANKVFYHSIEKYQSTGN